MMLFYSLGFNNAAYNIFCPGLIIFTGMYAVASANTDGPFAKGTGRGFDENGNVVHRATPSDTSIKSTDLSASLVSRTVTTRLSFSSFASSKVMETIPFWTEIMARGWFFLYTFEIENHSTSLRSMTRLKNPFGRNKSFSCQRHSNWQNQEVKLVLDRSQFRRSTLAKDVY
jgi:hypothetical protein